MSETRGLYERYVMPTYRPGPVLVRGKGALAWDEEGKEYLDFAAGIAVCQLGHAHPAVTAALREQAEKLTHCSNLFVNEWQPRLARKLSEIGGLGGKCFFANSGAEANECLIKLARKWGAPRGKFEVVTMEHSFHGRTLATLAATGQAKYRKDFGPDMPGFRHAAFNDLDAVRAAVTEKTAAILCEAVQGEGGVIPAAPGFLEGLRALCDEKGMLLFFDEVQCGVGRTGKWFGFQHRGARPDAFSMAKGIANGFPMGAVSAAPAVSDVLTAGTHASTFGGNPLASAVALATLETIERDGLLENAAATGARLAAGLRALAAEKGCIRDVRGLGLMLGAELDREAAPVALALREAGLLCIPTGERVLRFLPPLVVSAAQIDRALEVLARVLPAG